MTATTQPDPNDLVSLADVQAAARRLAGVAMRTPLLPFAPASDDRAPTGPVAPLAAAAPVEHDPSGARPAFRAYLKAENLQPIGAFKIRGAYNALAQLSPQERRIGVVTHSSGNHAQGVSRAARILGIRAVVVMPCDAPAIKVAGVRADGAEIVFVGPSNDERVERAHQIADRDGLALVPSYDDIRIIAGQGTAGLEIVEQVAESVAQVAEWTASRARRQASPGGGGAASGGVTTASGGGMAASGGGMAASGGGMAASGGLMTASDAGTTAPNRVTSPASAGAAAATERPPLAVLVPIGGGGLASGICVAVKGLRPDARVYGVEPELAADARDSLREGRIVRWDPELTGRTSADGMRTSALGRITFAHLSRLLDGIVTVSEAEIARAMAAAANAARIVVEPSGATAIAAGMWHRHELPAVGGDLVMVVSGGNVDPALYRELLRQGAA